MEIIYLYCILCYLFALGAMIQTWTIAPNSIGHVIVSFIFACLAPILLPIIAGVNYIRSVN